MLRFLREFWPVLLPIVIYIAWMIRQRSYALRTGEKQPRWRDGPWIWTVITTLALAIGSLMWIGIDQDRTGEHFEPAQWKNGKVIPGTIEK